MPVHITKAQLRGADKAAREQRATGLLPALRELETQLGRGKASLKAIQQLISDAPLCRDLNTLADAWDLARALAPKASDALRAPLVQLQHSLEERCLQLLRSSKQAGTLPSSPQEHAIAARLAQEAGLPAHAKRAKGLLKGCLLPRGGQLQPAPVRPVVDVAVTEVAPWGPSTRTTGRHPQSQLGDPILRHKVRGPRDATPNASADAQAGRRAAPPFVPERLMAEFLNFSQLREEDGTLRYTVGPVLANGTFSKFRIGLSPGGELVGIRELRITPKSGGEARPTTRTATAELNVRKEHEVLQRVGSPLQPRESFVVDGKVFEVVHLMAGDLANLCDNLSAMVPPIEAEEWRTINRITARQIASQVATCHAAGIIHQDIKIQNIFWAADGTRTLADFGLHYEGTRSLVNNAAGTPMYMAPEMLKGEDGIVHYDQKVDVYSFGVTLACLSADEDLFPGSDQSAFDFAKLKLAADDYAGWRAARSATDDPDGPLDWSKIPLDPGDGDDGAFTKLDRFARQFHAADPELCVYVFDHMLRVNPEHRDSAAQVAEYTEDLGDPAQRAEETALDGFYLSAGAALDARRETLVDKLRRYAATQA